MVKTRAMADLEMKQLLALMQEMKQNQEEKFGEMKRGLEALSKCQEKMKTGQDEIRREQEEKFGELKREQNEIFNELKREQEEMQSNILSVINTEVDVIVEKVQNNEERLGEIKGEIGKQFEAVETKFNAVGQEFEKLEREIGKKFEKEMEKVKEEWKKESLHRDSEIANEGNNLKNVYRFSESGPESSQHAPVVAKSSIKLSTYDGKTSWQVYKAQFTIVAEANGWDALTKARQLAASLRAEAADILRTISEDQHLNFDVLTNALELRFGEKCMGDYSRLQLKSRQQRPTETLQELATDVERLSHLAFADCPADVRDTLSLQYFIDGVRDGEIQKALRLSEVKDLKSALIYAMRVETAQQASRKDRHMIRGAEIDQTGGIEKHLKELCDILLTQKSNNDKNNLKKTVTCWRCGTEGHIQSDGKARKIYEL